MRASSISTGKPGNVKGFPEGGGSSRSILPSDNFPSITRGWVFAYDEVSLAQTAIYLALERYSGRGPVQDLDAIGKKIFGARASDGDLIAK